MQDFRDIAVYRESYEDIRDTRHFRLKDQLFGAHISYRDTVQMQNISMKRNI